jgi:hypothetical protein
MNDLDRHFRDQSWKKVHFQAKRPQNRQIRTISSSYMKMNIRWQNLFKRNFHFQGQIFTFSTFKVSPIKSCDTLFRSFLCELKIFSILTLYRPMHDLDSNFKDTVVE